MHKWGDSGRYEGKDEDSKRQTCGENSPMMGELLVEEKNANARLIVDAPGMYKLLESLANEMQATDSMGGDIGQAWLEKRIKRIHRRLAKARGEA